MSDPCAHLIPEARQFFVALQAENTKDWFEANKSRYTNSIRKPAEALGEVMAAELGRMTGRTLSAKIYRIKERASMMHSKTGKPVKFEITETTRQSLDRWIADPEMLGMEFLWPSRLHGSPHLSTRQYARILRGWVTSIGLEPSAYGTHSMRRTKVAQISKKTGNLRAVQLLLGHTKMDSTVRYLGVDIEDALTLSEGNDL